MGHRLQHVVLGYVSRIFLKTASYPFLPFYCFAVVKDKTNDKVYVNKNKNRQDNSKQFVVNGARFVYTRRGYEESLKSSGPLNNDFEVLVSCNL